MASIGVIEDILEKTLKLEDTRLIKEIKTACTPLHLDTGDFLIREGDQPTIVPILLTGIVRGFLLDANGQEITDCFAVHPGIPVMAAADLQMKSPLSMEALVPSDFLTIPIEIHPL